MAALGQTVSGAGHELNNPLATILSYAERSQRTLDERSPRLETSVGIRARPAHRPHC